MRRITKFDSLRWVGVLVLLMLSIGGAHAAGDPAKGKAQSMVCAACHGQDGATGLDGTYPNLAGQNEKYQIRQMRLIQNNTRSVPLMAGQLTGKSDQDLADIAAYYASLPAKLGNATGNDEDLALAAQIYRGGIAKKNVAACSACHNPRGIGNPMPGFPWISGQSAEYTVVQLKAYRESERRSDESLGSMMQDVAHGLTDGEIAILADYLQGLN